MQSAKSTIHYPMRRHLKTDFSMLRRKGFIEIIETDMYFDIERSMKGYHCGKVFLE
jgi:hypothetical protein